MAGMDWTSLIEVNVSPIELIVRGTALYWFLFLVLRFVLRRDAGGLGVADVLLVVLVADASQNAMTGGYTSVAEGFVLVGTLIGWNWFFDWAAFRWPLFARFVEPPPLPLVRNGRILHKNLRAEYLTVDDLRSQLRQHGIESTSDVRLAQMEGDGQITVLRFEAGEEKKKKKEDADDKPKPPPGR